MIVIFLCCKNAGVARSREVCFERYIWKRQHRQFSSSDHNGLRGVEKEGL